MLAALAELLCWTVLGLAAGFAAHWWKAHADVHPDILDKDRPWMNIALTEHSVVNYALDHRYDDAGYWEYHSLKNLCFKLVGGLVCVLLPVYATADGHAVARSGLCTAAEWARLTPIFCL